MKQAPSRHGIRPSTVLLILSCGLSCSEPLAPAAPVDPQVLAVTTFPTFEPFLTSRMSKFLYNDEVPMSAEEVGELVDQFNLNGTELEAWSRIATSEGEWSTPPSEAKMFFAMIPGAVNSLKELWQRSPWNEEELDRANGVAAYIARFPGGPRCSFREGSAEHNTRELQRIAYWFGEQVSQPAIFGSMIFTMDDGPWPGGELADGVVLTPTSKQAVGQSL